MAGDRENQRRIDAVHGTHDKGDDARGLVPGRGDQPVKQQVRNRIEKALLLRRTDVVKVAVVQIGEGRIEMIIAEIPIIIGAQDDRQDTRTDAD